MKDEIPTDQTAEDQPKENEQTEITVTDTISKNSRKHFKYRSNECLNCGHPLDLSDRYCPYCSQLNSTKQLSLGDFFGEFFKSIVSFDSRLRYTLKDLLFKPGTITNNYVKGQRLKYANPFRFFLSVSIIYFIASTFVATFVTNDKNDINTQINKVLPFLTITANEANDKAIDSLIANNIKIEEGTLPSTNEQLNDSIIKNSTLIDDNTKPDTTRIFDLHQKYVKQQELDSLSWSDANGKKVLTYINFYEDTKIANAKFALDSLEHNNTRYNRWLYDKNQAFERVKADPYSFYSYMINKVPFFLFFFTPIFALFFWLFYYKRNVNYMEHIVFVFHIFSFVFLSMLILLIVDTIIGIQILYTLLFLIIAPFYFYKALRNFYRQSRLLTALKFVLLSFVFITGSLIISTFFFLLTAAAY